MNSPHLWNINLSGSIHPQIGPEIHLPPYTDAYLISWAYCVIRWHGCQIERRKGGGHITEQIFSEDRQHLSGGGRDEFLKLGKRLWRSSCLLIPVPQTHCQIVIVPVRGICRPPAQRRHLIRVVPLRRSVRQYWALILLGARRRAGLHRV